MLSAEEEAALLASLRFKEDELWLKAMYRGRLHKYDVATVEPLSLAAEDDVMDHNGPPGVQAAEAAETRVCALDRARAIFANRSLLLPRWTLQLPFSRCSFWSARAREVLLAIVGDCS